MVDSPYRSGPIGLEENEMRVLVALVRLMIGVDERFSEGEAGAVGAIALEVGEDSFWTHMQASYDRQLSAEDALRAASALERAEAHETIYAYLADLASHDGFEPEELGLLERLAELWQLSIRST